MQNFRSEFYKEIKIGQNSFYLYKQLESWDNQLQESLAWITAYDKKEPESSNFIVESGASISEERMIKQIMDYLNKKYG